MSEIPNENEDVLDDEDELEDEDDQAQIDKELEEAGDDPVKLKEIAKKRKESKDKLFKRAKTAENELKTLKKGKKDDEDDSDEPKSNKSKKGEVVLDKADRAILRTEKISSEDEVALVKRIMKETGKDVEGVLASKYFQAELKDLRAESETEDATPGNTRRSGNSNRNSVEYWITKGELPPMNQPKLRQQVVNAKIAAKKNESEFSSNPIQ